MADLTKAEQVAINRLGRLQKTWPDTLWIFAADGVLHVMRKEADDQHAMLANGGVDPDYVVDVFYIDSDGGDW